MISLRADMSKKRALQRIEEGIHLVRGQRVMLDSDLASIYGVTTKRLNEQFKRNRARFPEDFAFQLSGDEMNALRSQFATSNKRGGRRYLPWVFTEHGAIMLASVLNSPVAVAASVRVVRAFVRLREMIASNAQLSQRLAELERTMDTHDEAIAELFATIRQLIEPPEPKEKREIGFHVRERGSVYRMKNAKRI